MDFAQVMKELESLGTEQNKRIYQNHGAREPHFGVPVGSMRPLAKKIKKDQALAQQLYESGNYDAMYLAGMIADPAAMTESDFEAWIDKAYIFMLSDYCVAPLLAEKDFAQSLCDSWIENGAELKASAAWTCYSMLLGILPDSEFDCDKLRSMLKKVENTIHSQSERVKYSMNSFVIALGISYVPLHEEAVESAAKIGKVTVVSGKTKCSVPLASQYIQKAADAGKLGRKRKRAGC